MNIFEMVESDNPDTCRLFNEMFNPQDEQSSTLRAHLHPATSTCLRHRCDITPK